MLNFLNVNFGYENCDSWDTLFLMSEIKQIVENWRNYKVGAPKTTTEVRSFLGLARYYHCFIQYFSRIVVPLTKLTRKEMKFNWVKEQNEAFLILYKKLCEAPILHYRRVHKTLWFLVMLQKPWMYFDETLKGNWPCFKAIKRSREKIYDAWFKVSDYCFYIEDLETLLVRFVV